jgi:Fur family ferric uptake transcriptional regulator
MREEKLTCESIFIEQLRKQSYRLTPQREMILLSLHQIGHPATAEELFTLVGEKSSSIELSTIYRTLDLLSSMNLITVIDTGDKQRLYELCGTETPHLHLVCHNCHKITSVETEVLQPLLDQWETEAHFYADLSKLTVSGLCEECKQAQTEDEKHAFNF